MFAAGLLYTTLFYYFQLVPRILLSQHLWNANNEIYICFKQATISIMVMGAPAQVMQRAWKEYIRGYSLGSDAEIQEQKISY